MLGVGSAPAYVVAADVNGDGKVDLISANAGDGTLTVMTNNGSGGFALAATLVVGNFPLFVTAADVNGDGKLDLISADFGSGGLGNTLTIWTNNGNGFGYNSTLTVGSGPYAVVAADVNGDGKVDLISANANDGTLTVLTNNGMGGFGLSATLPVGASASSYPDSVAAADVNGDGKVDLISANANDGTLTVLTNNGMGGFGLSATLTVG
ncbi:MAG: VCBS repeat-containing protein, partial [Verrucomicrobiota bacterium]